MSPATSFGTLNAQGCHVSDDIDRLCEQYARSQNGDACPQIEDLLTLVDASHRADLLLRLLAIELAKRARDGAPADRADYLKRFPDQSDTVEAAFDSHHSSSGTDRDTVSGRAATTETAAPEGNTRTAETSPPVSVDGYELLDELGRGGMGVVYRARQTRLNRFVAIKMILAGGHASDDVRQRFRIEAEAVAAMQHPNIIQIFDIGETATGPYFSLEYLDGGDLATAASTAWLGRDAAELVEKLARAMDYAHARGILHRDLKPANILLQSDGTPKISDFGLARNLEETSGLTGSQAMLGTPNYMAPEQAEVGSHPVGPASDVYSLGAILYQLVTGQPPFQSNSLFEILDQLRNQPPTPPREIKCSVDRELELICQKCMAKAPNDRYGTAAELADDLKRYLHNQPVAARVPRSQTWRRRSHSPKLPVICAALAVAALTCIAGAIVWNQSDDDDTEIANSAIELDVPFGLPPLTAPEDNALTVAKVALGKELFFDKALSVNHTVSCASCHDPKFGWSNGKRFAEGVHGQLSSRNVPTVVNAAFSEFLFWDGRVSRLEQQALDPILNPVEMAMPSRSALVARLRETGNYETTFNELFDDGLTAQNIGKAIAAFERTILSGNAPYDRYRAGDFAALSEDAAAGLQIFFGKADCGACHSGPNFTDQRFHNIGVGMNGPTPDNGRQGITGSHEDRGAFKTPTLREIAHTAPYMHDGSLETIEDVIEYYNTGGTSHDESHAAIAPLGLTMQEKRQLAAFLRQGLSGTQENDPADIASAR